MIGPLAISAPWFLLGIPISLAYLVYIYRRRNRETGARIGSTFLIAKLPKASPPARLFRPPLEFFRDLFVLSAIFLTLSGPGLDRGTKHFAIVVDTSLTMAARSGIENDSLLTATRRIISDYTVDLPQSTTFDLYESSPGFHLINSNPISRTELNNQLKPLQPVFAAAPLADEVSRLIESNRYDGVWAFSPTVLTDPASGTPFFPAGLRWVNLRSLPQFAELSNAMLSGIRSESGQIRVRYFSATLKEADAKIRLQCIVPTGTTYFDEAAVRLIPGLDQDLIFKAPLSECRAIRAKLLVEETGTGPRIDAIAEDNLAWLTLGAEKTVVNVVSSISPDQLGLSKIQGMTFRSVQSEAESGVPTIFHRVCPPPDWKGSFLAVQTGECQYGDLLRSSDPQTGLDLVRWAESHRILSYVNLGLLVPKTASILTLRPPFQEVIVSQRGPLAAISDTPTARSAWIGFELFPFEPKEDLSVGILTINLLRWVFDPTPLDPVARSSFASGSLSSIKYIDSGDLPPPPKDGASLLPIPGLVDRDSKILAVNIFDRTLSDLRHPPTESFKATQQSSDAKENRLHRDLRIPILFFVAILLTADLFFRRRRIRSK